MSMYEPAIDPPDEPMACTWCDGDLIVTVAAIFDCSGIVHNLTPQPWIEIACPRRFWIEIDCPRCRNTGSEPAQEPDPDRQRDEARERDAI
jgi:phage FluMu protein Com